ncbi:MAG TPA: hypothetical protein VIW68_12615 [Candidatus Sulfotelmatobacter sp.]
MSESLTPDYSAVRAKAAEIMQNAHALGLSTIGEKCAVDVIAAVEGDIKTGQAPADILRNLHAIKIGNFALKRSKWHPR